jgi:hypothetical protein
VDSRPGRRVGGSNGTGLVRQLHAGGTSGTTARDTSQSDVDFAASDFGAAAFGV